MKHTNLTGFIKLTARYTRPGTRTLD